MKSLISKFVTSLLLHLDKNIEIVQKEDYQKIEKFYTKEELQSFTAEEAVKMRIAEADKQYDRVVSLIKDCSDSESSLFVGKIKFYSETIEKLESKGF